MAKGKRVVSAKQEDKCASSSRQESAVTSVKKSSKYRKALVKAVKLIRAYESKQEARRMADGSQPKDLIDENKTPFYLQFALSKSVENAELKPILVPLPSPPRSLETAEVCLIVRNPQRKWKERIQREKHLLGMIKRVIDFEHLIKKYPTVTDKRQLLNSYDLFLADKKLMHLIPSHLGRTFRRSTKMPIGIVLPDEEENDDDEKPLSPILLEAMRLTPILMKPGTTVSVRVGDQSMTDEEISANGSHVIKAFKKKLQEQAKGIEPLNIQLQLSQSISVPLP